jgi:hypothetical protein
MLEAIVSLTVGTGERTGKRLSEPNVWEWRPVEVL